MRSYIEEGRTIQIQVAVLDFVQLYYSSLSDEYVN